MITDSVIAYRVLVACEVFGTWRARGSIIHAAPHQVAPLAPPFGRVLEIADAEQERRPAASRRKGRARG